MAKDTSKFSAPRGTQDIYGPEVRKWQALEKFAREHAELYDIQEFRTPMYEHTEVYDRENDASDIVNKEMYTFVIKKKDGESPSLTLRPEGTAGIVRAYVQHKLYGTGGLQKYFYIAPNFRYERPQKGRLRIHHQFGVEYFGLSNPLVDAEVLQVGLSFIQKLGVTSYKVLINTLGDPESQATYREALREHFSKYIDTMCEDCHRRLQQNPLRILDCKVDHDHIAIKTAPLNRDYLNEASQTYFATVLQTLDALKIQYEVDSRLVRGLDYYHHTVFEVVSTHPKTGAQSTIFAGGRYNELVEYYGGPAQGAVGFGIGLERLLLLLDDEGLDISMTESLDVYGMPRDTASNVVVLELLDELRNLGYRADMDFENRSMKAQFKQADRLKSHIVIICGEDELITQSFTLKNLETQEQVTLPKAAVFAKLESWLAQ